MIIAIVNRRGGVGKTATAHAIGAGLAKRGNKVLFVDLDSQCNLTFDTGAQTGRNSVMEVLTGTATAAAAIQKTPGADIMPASPSLAAADLNIDGTGKEYRLKEALEKIKGDYDHIIIDTPPALGVLTVNALTAADICVIAAQAEVHSLQGIALLNESIELVRKYTNHSLRIGGIVCTRYNGRAVLSRDMIYNLENAAAEIGTRVYNTKIRECISIKEAQAMQQSIFDYAPKSNAAADYEELINEIMGGAADEEL